MTYQTSGKKKPGPKRVLKLEEEFVMSVVRLSLGLMGRHLADIFSLHHKSVVESLPGCVFYLLLSKKHYSSGQVKEEVRKNLPRCFKW